MHVYIHIYTETSLKYTLFRIQYSGGAEAPYSSMSRKFLSIDDAVAYINDELTKRGYLSDAKLKFGTPADKAEGSQDQEEQLSRDKLTINVIHKLLQRVDTLQEKLKVQDEHLRKSQDQLLQRVKLAESEVAKLSNTPEKQHRVTKVTKIQYRDKDTKPLEAKVRKLQLELEEQSLQLRQYADGDRTNITWGTSLGPLLDADQLVNDKRPNMSPVDMLSHKMGHVIDTNQRLSKDLKAAVGLISDINKTVYTRFVLQIDAPSDGQAEKKAQDQDDLDDITNPTLKDLARDWKDIKSQLP